MIDRASARAGANIAVIAIGLFIANANVAAQASPQSRAAWPDFTVVVEQAKEGPPGWAEFCRNYRSECDVKSSTPHKLALTPEVWAKLVEVNRWANTHIKPVSDKKHWGRYDRWYFADDGEGDCKDYV